MHLKLAKRLIEKRVIRVGSEIEALYRSPDTFGVGGKIPVILTVVGARLSKEGAVTLLARSQKTTDETVRIPCEDVLLVDGMSPTRLAASAQLTKNGDDIPLGKRRGRPLKNASDAR